MSLTAKRLTQEQTDLSSIFAIFWEQTNTKKKNRNEQQLKNTKKIRKTTVGLEQVQIIDGKEVT